GELRQVLGWPAPFTPEPAAARGGVFLPARARAENRLVWLSRPDEAEGGEQVVLAFPAPFGAEVVGVLECVRPEAAEPDEAASACWARTWPACWCRRPGGPPSGGCWRSAAPPRPCRPAASGWS